MLFEIISTTTMLGILGTSYAFQNKNSDHDRIKKVADECGLKTKEESIRIYKRRQRDGHTEYVYKMPLGLSFAQFEDKKQHFIDGLNNKSRPEFDWKQFKLIRHKLDKQIEMEYDGMLKVRVYDEGLKERYELTDLTSKGWKVPLGATYNDRVIHDFEESPHILIGGATDTGKSTTLNVIISTLLYNQPDNVEFTLLDLKGGLEFGDYEDLKQTKHFATDLASSFYALKSVQQEMERNFQKLRRMKKRDIKQAGIKKRQFVIIDEAAELASSDESDKDIKKVKVACENMIKDISRRGRACGIRLIYATQYPTTETISSQVKRNLITRICFPVDTSTASNVVLDEKGAEDLPLIKGRAIYKRHRKRVMQSYLIEDNTIQEIIKPHKGVSYAPIKAETTASGGNDSPQLKEIGLSD